MGFLVCHLGLMAGVKRTFDHIPPVLREDLQGAARALLRLQRVYLLSTDDIAHGSILGRQVSK